MIQLSHFWVFIQRMCSMLSITVCPTFCDPMNRSPPGSSVHGFSRQEYWSGLPFPPPGDIPNPGLNLCLFHLPDWQADLLPLSHLGSPIQRI